MFHHPASHVGAKLFDVARSRIISGRPVEKRRRSMSQSEYALYPSSAASKTHGGAFRANRFSRPRSAPSCGAWAFRRLRARRLALGVAAGRAGNLDGVPHRAQRAHDPEDVHRLHAVAGRPMVIQYAHSFALP